MRQHKKLWFILLYQRFFICLKVVQWSLQQSKRLFFCEKLMIKIKKIKFYLIKEANPFSCSQPPNYQICG